MKLRTKPRIEDKCEYTVEFECVSTFLVGFQEAAGLTDRQILEKATRVANETFDRGGCLMTERATAEGFWTFTALGVDRSTGHVLGRPTQQKPRLKIIKGSMARNG
jgi:hypothetical protein